MGKHLCKNLHDASYWRHQECILTWLDRGANINDKNDNGRIPLHRAIYYGD